LLVVAVPALADVGPLLPGPGGHEGVLLLGRRDLHLVLGAGEIGSGDRLHGLDGGQVAAGDRAAADDQTDARRERGAHRPRLPPTPVTRNGGRFGPANRSRFPEDGRPCVSRKTFAVRQRIVVMTTGCMCSRSRPPATACWHGGCASCS